MTDTETGWLNWLRNIFFLASFYFEIMLFKLGQPHKQPHKSCLTFICSPFLQSKLSLESGCQAMGCVNQSGWDNKLLSLMMQVFFPPSLQRQGSIILKLSGGRYRAILRKSSSTYHMLILSFSAQPMRLKAFSVLFRTKACFLFLKVK